MEGALFSDISMLFTIFPLIKKVFILLIDYQISYSIHMTLLFFLIRINSFPAYFQINVGSRRPEVFIKEAFTSSWSVRIKYIKRLAEQLVPIDRQPISRWDLNLHVLFLRLECFSLLHWNTMRNSVERVILFDTTLQLLFKK